MVRFFGLGLTIERYCPPALWQSGLVWTAFSVVGESASSELFKTLVRYLANTIPFEGAFIGGGGA